MEERLLLKALIENDFFCGKVVSKWDGSLFESEDSNLIAQWCVEYFRRYNSSPKDRIALLFSQWADRVQASSERRKALIGLLEELSQEKAAVGDEYLLDLAGRYFTSIRIGRECELAQAEIDSGRWQEAYDRLIQLRKVELGDGAVIRPANDYDVWYEVFHEERQEPLVWYPGKLEDWLSRWLVRGTFFSFMGPDKSGKSTWLLDLAYRAVKDRRRVAYFEVGDMGRDGVIERLAVRCTALPLYGGRENGEWTEVDWPVRKGDDGWPEMGVKRIHGRLTSGRAFLAFQKLCRGRELMRVSCHPNGTISVNGIRGILADWEREFWVPDVVVIDYADILAPPEGVKDTLDQIDETWKRLRRMSQELHCLVVTATQSSAAAYRQDGGLLGKRHFSGRKTKLAHVNGMIGINVTPESRERGVSKLNWIVRREGYYRESEWVTVAGCWVVGNPAVLAW